MSDYQKKGYESRMDYLKSLAEEYGISIREVSLIADMLGSSEDFDGLISALEDFEGADY